MLNPQINEQMTFYNHKHKPSVSYYVFLLLIFVYFPQTLHAEDNVLTTTTSFDTELLFTKHINESEQLTVTLITETVKRMFLTVICLSIIVSCLVGNLLVIIAVIIVRKLHTQDNASNFLIVSLAVSDLLVGVLVMPYALYLELSENNGWYLGAILCDIWTMSDVLLCTASILNLCAISVDRYFIILHAMVYTQRRNAKLMFLMILVVWVLSALISIPPLFGWGKPSSRLEDGGNVCAVSSDLKYQIFATSLAFYLPLITMIIIYINIYRAAEKIKKKEMLTNGQVQYRRSSSNQQSSAQKTPLMPELPDLISNGTVNPSSSQLTENFSIESKQNNYSLNHSSNSNHLINKTNIPIMIVNDGAEQLESKAFKKELPGRPSSVSVFNDFSNRIYRRVSMAFQGFKRSSNATNLQKKNQKATKALGVIMGCFILCWLPFFILALIKPITLQNGMLLGDFIPKWLDSFLLWLGYFNSALNPMIYARFNREFRRPFVEILCFRCRNINDKLRDLERRKMNLDIAPKSRSNGRFNSIIGSGFNPDAMPSKNNSNGAIKMHMQTKTETQIIKDNQDEKGSRQFSIGNLSAEYKPAKSVDVISTLTEPDSYANSSNSSKLKNLFFTETPIIVFSEIDENNNLNTKANFIYNSEVSIFDQLEQAFIVKSKNESFVNKNNTISNEPCYISFNNESSKSLVYSSNLHLYKKRMLRKKFFEAKNVHNKSKTFGKESGSLDSSFKM